MAINTLIYSNEKSSLCLLCHLEDYLPNKKKKMDFFQNLENMSKFNSLNKAWKLLTEFLPWGVIIIYIHTNILIFLLSQLFNWKFPEDQQIPVETLW